MTKIISSEEQEKPAKSSQTSGEQDRNDRLAAALRENLRKRKAQARLRSRAATTSDPSQQG